MSVFNLFICSVISAFISGIMAFIPPPFKGPKKPVRIILMIIFISSIFSSFFLGFVDHNLTKPEITIDKKTNRVVLSTDDKSKIEYKTSTFSDAKWIPYTNPIELEKETTIIAQSFFLFLKSEPVKEDISITENGLFYIGEANKPQSSLKEIKASYIYRDASGGKSGNYYIGYQIKKSDIIVTGTDLEGNQRQVDEFTYSPNILKPGKNTIKIEYSTSTDTTIFTNLFINANTPSLINLDAKYIGDTAYIDTPLEINDFIVEGTYEDGTKSDIKEFSISTTKLNEGENKITISCGALSKTIKITAVDRSTVIGAEKEPNDSIGSANEIDFNVSYTANLKDEDDKDYYRLKLDKKGKLTLKLSHPKIDDSNVLWVTSLLHSEKNEIIQMETVGQDAETLSHSARLSPGVYYIKVSPKFNHSNLQYTLTVLFEEEDTSYETEPNNDLNNQATPVSFNTPYTGNLTTENDVDYFKFSINSKQKVWINFKHPKIDNGNNLWNLYLSGNSNDTLLSFSSSGDISDFTSDKIRLPSGDYYLTIKNAYHWSNLDYTFIIYSEEDGDNTEDESNNDYTDATKITPNSPMTGNLQSIEDVDFYYFELVKPSPVQITFTHTRTDTNSIVWIYELSSDSATIIKDNSGNRCIYISGDSAKETINTWDLLPAGTYYLKIYSSSSSSYCNDDYQITVS